MPRGDTYRISIHWPGDYGENEMHRNGLMELDGADMKIFSFGRAGIDEFLHVFREGNIWYAGKDAWVEWRNSGKPDISPGMKISSFRDGRMLAECRICPQKVRDLRDVRNGPATSGHMSKSYEEAESWFRDHVETDMHAYYRTNGTVEPFIFARSYR